MSGIQRELRFALVSVSVGKVSVECLVSLTVSIRKVSQRAPEYVVRITPAIDEAGGTGGRLDGFCRIARDDQTQGISSTDHTKRFVWFSEDCSARYMDCGRRFEGG